ncbi:protein-L-isoaspartate(D-aspartate) O-methyltransferase [Neoroseomonas soli]|uniref:Protein-L-isoaspartate O-methyltransferase n=1 Tax=Neoroseomonas soli TaxID=1081025 RepID=A0A9X9WZJ2_9PROT|nr:protein-L-isoaspartate(D-aspartate) O-methyltransferase [Neoroseomonas soli]MBR0672571.1 protein-L-isoaspartate(D-aspartate) O-methyltransferase [Neoroseomonas soli]
MKPMDERHFAILRRHMVEVIAIHVDLLGDELRTDALDPRVMEAMLRVPRHLFVPLPLVPHAYQDGPLPIGFDKTISQPFICALLAHLLALEPDHEVLEIGTGLGYLAAILSELARQVWSVEIVEEFATEAELRLGQLGYANVSVRAGDGARGWAEHAPFDRIVMSAGAEKVPPALLEQLRPGGLIVLPMGPPDEQRLVVLEKREAGAPGKTESIPVRFGLLETVI